MKEIITTEMKTAMKSGDKERLNVLRLINGKMTEYLKEGGDESGTVAVLDSMIKERNKSIKAYLEGNRRDLADQEQYEINVISEFLPKRMTAEQIQEIVNSVIESTGAFSIKSMGMVMKEVKSITGDSAKPSDVAAIIKKTLM